MIPAFVLSADLPRPILSTLQRIWAVYVNGRRYRTDGDAFVWPSREKIVNDLGISERSLRRHLADLARRGWLRESVREIRGRLTRGWELLNPRSTPDDLADGTGQNGRPSSLYEPELNQHHNADARATGGKRALVGGGLGEDILHRDTADVAPACTTVEALQVDPQEKSGGGAVRRPGAPRTADQVRAAALWHAYEARRVRELGGKPHRGEPRYRDLVHVVELVDHAARTRTDGDREAAWRAVATYGDGAIEIADWFRGTRGHDDRVWWRADGWEWSPYRFDRVMRDIDDDITGQRAERAHARRLAERDEERRREEAEQVPMSTEAFHAFIDEMLSQGGGAAYGLAHPT